MSTITIAAIAAAMTQRAADMAAEADKTDPARHGLCAPETLAADAVAAAEQLMAAKKYRGLAADFGKTEYAKYLLEKADKAEREAYLIMNTASLVSYYGGRTLDTELHYPR